MSKIEVEFAFELGQIVYVRSSLHTHNVSPTRYVIAERIAQECHGGVQRLYKIYGRDDFVPEIVLTSEEPAFRPVSDEEIADMLRRQDAEWQEMKRRTKAMTRDDK